MGNELDYRAERAREYAVDDLAKLVQRVMSAEIPPWTVWPDPPCGSADAYFRLCTGLSYAQIEVLLNTFGIMQDALQASAHKNK
jgi:hypothetical protein